MVLKSIMELCNTEYFDKQNSTLFGCSISESGSITGYCTKDHYVFKSVTTNKNVYDVYVIVRSNKFENSIVIVNKNGGDIHFGNHLNLSMSLVDVVKSTIDEYEKMPNGQLTEFYNWDGKMELNKQNL